MSLYAAKTKVSVDSSRTEIEKTLRRYGADAFSYAYESKRSIIVFRAHDRMVRFEILTGERDSDQKRRQQWRALCLVVKAKLEAVSSGIAEFEQEFLAHIVLPDNSTVGESIRPVIANAYASGKMPSLLLPGLGETGEGK